VLSRIELAALSTAAGSAAFAGIALLAAACLRYVNAQNLNRASPITDPESLIPESPNR